jgi:hypothetical protein
MISVFHPEFPQLLSSGYLAGWRLLRLLLKSRGDYNHHSRLVEEKNPEDAIEFFDPQLEYFMPQLFHELSLHPITVDAKAIDKCVNAGGSPVVQQIDKLTSGRSSVGQFDIFDSELGTQAASESSIALLR